MARNLDVTALRSFVAVADEGKVTAAAARLNLTQSAVSMQLKRLEEALDQALFDRSGRGVALTSEGELLLSYARRMIALNDEIWSRMTHEDFEGELIFGVPHDIVYPHVPTVLRRFARKRRRGLIAAGLIATAALLAWLGPVVVRPYLGQRAAEQLRAQLNAGLFSKPHSLRELDLVAWRELLEQAGDAAPAELRRQVRLVEGLLAEGDGRSSAPKLGGLDAREDWEVIQGCWSQASSYDAHGLVEGYAY